MANRWSWLEKLLARPVGIVVLCTLGLIFLAAVEGFGALFVPEKAGALVSVISFFGLIGVFLGTIYATEVEAGAEKNRPLIRTVLCATVGAGMAYVFRAPVLWFPVVIAIAGFLGWLGMRWARYVDF